MSDGNLLAFGCAVSFLALGGAYVFIRERWEAKTRRLRRSKIARREALERVA